MEFLVEVCDPCEAPGFGYTVNGVRVSDFYTTHYFEPPTRAAAGGTYDFMGHITKPTRGAAGRISELARARWHVVPGEVLRYKPVFVKLGQFDKSFGALRPWIDSLTLQDRLKLLKQRAVFPSQVLVKLPREDDNDLATEASCRRAGRLREQIKRVRNKAKRRGK